jgi:hypothetical protein
MRHNDAHSLKRAAGQTHAAQMTIAQVQMQTANVDIGAPALAGG